VIVWQESLDTAVQKAKAEGKLIVMYFFDPSCIECQQLEAVTWIDEGVANVLNSRFIPLRINVLKQRSMCKEYRIVRTPTIAFLDMDGREHRRFTGFFTPPEMCARILLDGAETAIYLKRYDLAQGHMNTAFATAKGLLSCRRRSMIPRQKLSIQEGSKLPAAEGGGHPQGISRQ
jgi:thioredoxin-like negative regulator of GroEL